MAKRKQAEAAEAEAEEQEAPEAEETGPTTKERVLELVEAGKSRSEIAEELGLSYAAVYHHTKNVEGLASGRRGVLVEYDGETIPRAEAMRRDYAAGMKVGEIAKKYEVIYQVAWQATKGREESAEDEAEEEAVEAEA